MQPTLPNRASVISRPFVGRPSKIMRTREDSFGLVPTLQTHDVDFLNGLTANLREWAVKCRRVKVNKAANVTRWVSSIPLSQGYSHISL